MHATLTPDLHLQAPPPLASFPDCFDAVGDELLVECRQRLFVVEELQTIEPNELVRLCNEIVASRDDALKDLSVGVFPQDRL